MFPHNVAVTYRAAPTEGALRVLTAILNDRKPSPDDVAELRRLAPDCADLPFDELACEVVWRALHQSEKAVGGGE